jgi:hypothetical protein
MAMHIYDLNHAISMAVWLAVPVLLVLWVVLVFRKHDFSRTRKLGFLLIGLFGLVLAASLMFFALMWMLSCFKGCEEGYEMQRLWILVQAVGLTWAYTYLVRRTWKSLQSNRNNDPA